MFSSRRSNRGRFDDSEQSLKNSDSGDESSKKETLSDMKGPELDRGKARAELGSEPEQADSMWKESSESQDSLKDGNSLDSKEQDMGWENANDNDVPNDVNNDGATNDSDSDDTADDGGWSVLNGPEVDRSQEQGSLSESSGKNQNDAADGWTESANDTAKDSAQADVNAGGNTADGGWGELSGPKTDREQAQAEVSETSTDASTESSDAGIESNTQDQAGDTLASDDSGWGQRSTDAPSLGASTSESGNDNSSATETSSDATADIAVSDTSVTDTGGSDSSSEGGRGSY